MSIEHAISMARNKALKELAKAIDGPVDYCWQEESADEARVFLASSILRDLRKEEERIKEKYRKKKQKDLFMVDIEAGGLSENKVAVSYKGKTFYGDLAEALKFFEKD